jgi:hypothetical protein
MLDLQKQAGNHAVQVLLRPKLRVGGPADAAEQEADSLAAEATHEGNCSCAPGEPKCQHCREEEERTIRRKPHAGGESPRAVDHVRLGAARPLAAADRIFFESRYRADLSAVRLHDNPDAAASTAQLDARAFTVGHDIAFGRGEYDPHSPQGRLLLAHELAHVALGHSGVRRQKTDAPSSQVGTEPLTCQPEIPGVCVAPKEEAKAPPDPGPRTVFFGGYTLGTGPEYLRSVLAQIGKERGYDALEFFVSALESSFVSSPEGASAQLSQGGGQGSEAAYTPDQLSLLAEIAPVMRSELDRLEADYRAFGDLVRNAAVVRLTRNHHNLGLWRDYVQSLAPRQVMAMAVAQKEKPILMAVLHSHAQGPFNPMDVYEQRAWSRSRWERDYLERLATGKIHGGCENCHEQKLAKDLESLSPTRGEAAIPLALRMPMYAGVNVETPAPGAEIAGPGEKRPAVPDWAFSSIGDRLGSQAIAASLNQIKDYLKPLGDAGYRIIKDDMVASATDGSELVAAVIATIDARREVYLKLIPQIQDPGYNFIEPLQMLQQLIPFADPAVQDVVRGEMRHQQEAKEAASTAQFILGIAAMLLTIFPPTAPLGLALGAGLALWGLSTGYEDWQQGRRFQMGMGAGIFTREQEDAGRTLEAMGMLNMVLSAFALADMAVGSAKLLRAPAPGVPAAIAADQVVGAEIETAGMRIRVEGLEGPSPTATVTHADGAVEQMSVQELEAKLASGEAGKAPGTTAEPAGAAAAEHGPPLEEGVPVEEVPPNSPEAQSTEAPPNTAENPQPGDPGSPEHKAARWAEYQARPNAGWSYERWSKVYDLNMKRAMKASAAEKAFHEMLGGWGKPQVTVDVEGVPRRLDLEGPDLFAGPGIRHGVEYKTGYITLSQDIKWEVLRDSLLVQQGRRITWIFEGTASKPLLQALDDAGIKYLFR